MNGASHALAMVQLCGGGIAELLMADEPRCFPLFHKRTAPPMLKHATRRHFTRVVRVFACKINRNDCRYRIYMKNGSRKYFQSLCTRLEPEVCLIPYRLLKFCPFQVCVTNIILMEIHNTKTLSMVSMMFYGTW